jgi:DASS family divalent anion:Na+ symporter
VGIGVWRLPVPAGVEPGAWHLLAIFVATIAGIILRPLPMGAVALVATGVAVLSRTLTIEEATAGFGAPVVWLVVAAFFIATTFIHTGLGMRIAYHFMRVLGKHTLGLAYGFVATDLVLAPLIPSNTARAGGVIFPILQSLCASLRADAPGDAPRDAAGDVAGFLTFTAYQATCVTSAMFLTAMVANPLAVELAAQQGIEITWTRWALAASVPGLVSLAVVPLLIFYLYPVKTRETPEAPELARRHLREMGPMARNEWILLCVFALLLSLWIFGSTLGVATTTTAIVGVGALLVTGALPWEKVLREKAAWDTLIWFAVLVMMASQLGERGLVDWFSENVASVIGGESWLPAFLGLSLIYFYSHYFFASNTAHVSAMYAPFLVVALAVGTPPLFAALVLGYFSNLFASMTHYGTAPAPIFFGSGNVALGTWWKLGALISVVNIAIWLGIGSLWWKALGIL